MTELRYPTETLRGDYIRAGIGLLLTLGPALAIPLTSPANYFLFPAAALFLAYAWRTWRRQRTRVAITAEGISLFGSQPVSLAWRQVRSVRLSYFSTQRDRTGGWMQLTLKGIDPQRPGTLRAIHIDSTLPGFDAIVRAAANAAALNGLQLSDATRANLSAAGIDPTAPLDGAPGNPDGATAYGRERV
jgi:hypothetical protein